MLNRARFVHAASFQPWVVPTLLGWQGGTGCPDPALQQHQVPDSWFLWGNNEICKWEKKGAKRESVICELKWANASDWPLQEDYLSLFVTSWKVNEVSVHHCELSVYASARINKCFAVVQSQWENYNQLAFLKQKLIVHFSEMTLISDCFGHSTTHLYL